MLVTRLIAIGLLIFAAIPVGAELTGLVRGAHWHGISASQLWLTLHTASFDTAHAFGQRYLPAPLWDPIAEWILAQPAWAVAGVPGVILLWFSLGHKASGDPAGHSSVRRKA